MAIKDEYGNLIWKQDDGRIFLYLVKLSHIRYLGQIRGDAWYIDRLPMHGDGPTAKGQGHWHHILGCWLINREVCMRAESLGVRRVIFYGYDACDKPWLIDRLIEFCVNQPEAHYGEQGFERQLEFPFELNIQYSLWDNGEDKNDADNYNQPSR